MSAYLKKEIYDVNISETFEI